ncbi:hypothetical protein T484DRAFT_3066922 [Baffinella frigidus]|nr:hypothetical protein T484DRAFT_3066922 [Cryptophyta sp. CCMP2293]
MRHIAGTPIALMSYPPPSLRPRAPQGLCHGRVHSRSDTSRDTPSNTGVTPRPRTARSVGRLASSLPSR